MLKNISSFVGLFLLGLFCLVPVVEARENVTDWYIEDLRAEFVLGSDSTMVVTEWITADCGEAPDKHGIFRIVPTEARTENGVIKTPIELLSITDFEGKRYAYTETVNGSDATITWKIGDANKTVKGVNRYKIVYEVKNVMRFGNVDFDEFYWNIGGNFWTLPIDAFRADIVFPQAIRDTAKLSYYTGVLGSKERSLVTENWQNDRTLSFVANRLLQPGEGVTVSVGVPKGIFAPYQFGWWELYGQYFWFVIPAGVLWFCFKIWKKYGDDPRWDKVVIPEYEIPENLSALELGMLMTNGTFRNEFVTAAIVGLAVKGALGIRESKEKILFFSATDFVLEKKDTALPLTTAERLLFDKLFESGDTVKLSSLKNEFYKVLPEVKKSVIALLVEKKLIEKTGLTYRIGLIIIGVIMGGVAIPLLGQGSFFGAGAMVLSGMILIGFGIIMPKRTLRGVEVNWKIAGLKLYMEKAEQARQQFYEKEQIFEILLPVAIVFGMTKEWIRKMKEMYGEDYFTSYHPAWFVASDFGGFDADSFASRMESLSSSIASNAGTSSGSSGSGSSGGGGGGGGGGGW